jgi:hypothetical protein
MKNAQELAYEIEEFVQQSAYLEELCAFLELDLMASPLYNFRDALSHYARFYEARNDEERVVQAACLEEHLFRGIKDSIIFIVYEMRTKVSTALDAAVLETRTIQSELRSLLHEYKDLELQLRKNSETGINRKLQSSIEILYSIIEKTQDFSKKHKLNSKGQLFNQSPV